MFWPLMCGEITILEPMFCGKYTSNGQRIRVKHSRGEKTSICEKGDDDDNSDCKDNDDDNAGVADAGTDSDDGDEDDDDDDAAVHEN